MFSMPHGSNVLSCPENCGFGVSSRVHSIDQDWVNISETFHHVSFLFKALQQLLTEGQIQHPQWMGQTLQVGSGGFIWLDSMLQLKAGFWNVGFWVRMASRTQCPMLLLVPYPDVAHKPWILLTLWALNSLVSDSLVLFLTEEEMFRGIHLRHTVYHAVYSGSCYKVVPGYQC